jgi:hypothetical protein
VEESSQATGVAQEPPLWLVDRPYDLINWRNSARVRGSS